MWQTHYQPAKTPNQHDKTPNQYGKLITNMANSWTTWETCSQCGKLFCHLNINSSVFDMCVDTGKLCSCFESFWCHELLCSLISFIGPQVKPQEMTMDTLNSYSGWNSQSQEMQVSIDASGELTLRRKLQEYERKTLKEEQVRAELKATVARKDVVIADQLKEIEALKSQIKRYQDGEKYSNGYPCRYAYRGCSRLVDNIPNKRTHEEYCNFRKLDQNGQPMPLSAAQKKKQQKKKRSLQQKAGVGP